MAAKIKMSGSERAPFGVSVPALLVLLFLHIPIWVIFLYAFTTDEAAFTFPLPGFTLKWIGVALQRTDFWDGASGFRCRWPRWPRARRWC